MTIQKAGIIPDLHRFILAQRHIIDAFLAMGVTAKLTDGKGKSVLDCAESVWIREMLV